ncbi:MAG TPA: class I SAM-dependent methyltransferase [Povalibacter sp.]|uniref:class I SAM-dependent methyltransferase n=1 Tax=Povalibacter sp. TaxID=1962978 RepID=UPI002CCA6EDD|nr:class I SAM-dependent methyltransferase [Povalibacter sp.]HMN46510.1 class I SAM-dependent methyltransferase [Povalibacter sp.]
MNDLERYFYGNSDRVIHKWKHYFEIYDRHFSRYRDQEVTIVEIGVFKGGSLQMWKNYFGPKARIVGVDINPDCAAFAEEQVEVLIGSQEDRSFLRSLKERVPVIDILIDDGGHTMTQQITTFEELFPHVAHDGVYLCEDLHTSYWRGYGGGYRAKNTFIEYSKNFIDYIHAWHVRDSDRKRQNRWYKLRQQKLSVTDFTRSVHSLHFYDSILVVEKRPMVPPSDIVTGQDPGQEA